MKNLKLRSVRYIVFKEDSTWYAVALELNIIESGDDPREVLLFLLEAVRGYVTSATKNRLPDYVLNQTAAEEYETLWRTIEAHLPVPSPFAVFAHGETTLANNL